MVIQCKDYYINTVTLLLQLPNSLSGKKALVLIDQGTKPLNSDVLSLRIFKVLPSSLDKLFCPCHNVLALDKQTVLLSLFQVTLMS